MVTVAFRMADGQSGVVQVDTDCMDEAKRECVHYCQHLFGLAPRTVLCGVPTSASSTESV